MIEKGRTFYSSLGIGAKYELTLPNPFAESRVKEDGHFPSSFADSVTAKKMVIACIQSLKASCKKVVSFSV